jgi:geranylgeranyl diphosphate synthase, type II
MALLDNFSSEYKHLIESKLKQYLSFKIDDPRAELAEAMLYSISAKAKRIRPLIMIATTKLFNNKVKQIFPLACAIEMIHTYSLIHDDLPAMDNDDFRRGQPTCHKKFGEDIAILAGDTLNTYAFEILAKELPKHYLPENVLQVISMLAIACGVKGMAGGQVLDLKTDISNQDYDYLKKMHALKTGAIIKVCVTLPAILEGASSQELAHLERYGQHLGLLFQIVDDILDVVGKKETLGKSPNKDQEQNKLTYTQLFGLEKAKELMKNEADKAYNQLKSLSGLNTEILEEMIVYLTKRNF